MDECPDYYRYWGKVANGKDKYHLLCITAWTWRQSVLSCWIRQASLSRLAYQLKVAPSWLQCWVTLSELHDIGKFATAFQGWLLICRPALYLNPRMRYSERHDTLGFILWQNVLSRQWLKNGGFNVDVRQSNLAKLLRDIDSWLEIVTGHHGEPPKRMATIRHQNFFTVADEDAASCFQKDVTALLLRDFDNSMLVDRNLRSLLKLSSWMLAGVVVLADWIGSGRNPESYCQVKKSLAEYWKNHAQPFAEQVIATADLVHSKVATFEGTRHLFHSSECLRPSGMGREAQLIRVVSFYSGRCYWGR